MAISKKKSDDSNITARLIELIMQLSEDEQRSLLNDLEKTPEDKSGKFDEPFDNYTYETFVKESPYLGISEIIVVVKAEKEEVKLNAFVFK